MEDSETRISDRNCGYLSGAICTQTLERAGARALERAGSGSSAGAAPRRCPRARRPIMESGVCAGSKAARASKGRSEASRQDGWQKVQGRGRSPHGMGGQSFVVSPI